MGIVFAAIVLIAIVLITWLDWENPDKKSISMSAWDAETVRLNNQRKSKQIVKLEERVRKLNEANPGRLFYRVGPRIKEYSAEEIAKINFTKSEYERLNAPYALHQKHYFIKGGELIHVGEEAIKRYKFEEKVRKINRDYENGIQCHFDHRNMKIINTTTKEEIPFNPDEYILTGD